jgi:hypothetical protein
MKLRQYYVRERRLLAAPTIEQHYPGGLRSPDPKIAKGSMVSGKILVTAACERVALRAVVEQGIALDIGSILDGWANISSRIRHQAGSRAFTLEHLSCVGTDWEQMTTAPAECIAEFDIRDATY